MTDTDVPEADWSPLTRAFHDALWDARIVLPKRVERALVAAVVDRLSGEGVVLAEVAPP